MTKIIIATAAFAALACGKEPAGSPDQGTPPEGQKPAAPAAAPSTEPAPAPPAAVPDTDEQHNPDLSSEAAGAPSTDVSPESAAVPGEIPTAEDFEEKAATDVGKGNLETEVSRMEKELGVRNQ